MSQPGLSEGQVRAALAEVILEVAGISADLDRTFFEEGLTSATLVEVHSRLQTRLGHAMPITDLFRYPTRRALARQIAAGSTVQAVATAAPPQPRTGRLTPQDRRELRARLRVAGGEEP